MAWMMNPAEEPKKLSKNVLTKAISKSFNKALSLSYRRKTVATSPISNFDTLEEGATACCVTDLSKSDDAFESRLSKFRRSDSCSTQDSSCDSLPSLPGSVESDDEEDDALQEDTCFDQPELKRIAKLVHQRSCQNGLECAPEESEQTKTCIDDEFNSEKAMLKFLVKSFAKEANSKSGLKCSIFEDQTSTYVPAKLFLDRSLTMILVHNSKKINIPLSNVCAAHSYEDLKECFPDSKLLPKLSGVEDPGASAFIHHRPTGSPESWISLNFADEESKERCVISINVLQKLAEIRQQRSREHLANHA